MEAAPNIAWLAANYSTLLCYTVHTSKPHVPVQCACTKCQVQQRQSMQDLIQL